MNPPIGLDVVSLFDGLLSRLQSEGRTLQRYHHNYASDFEPWTRQQMVLAIEALKDAIDLLMCEQCASMATVLLTHGRYCAKHAEAFTVCAGCGGDDLTVSDVVWKHEQPYHAACVGFEEAKS